MAYMLEDLVVDRVDLVDEGANSEAFIELYKRKEKHVEMDVTEIISKMKPEHAELISKALEESANALKAAQDDLAKVTKECEEAKEELAKLEEEKKEAETVKAGGAAFDEAETIKSMPEAARELFSKMKAQKEAAEEEARNLKEAEEVAKANAKVDELKALPIEKSKLANIVRTASPDVLDMLTTVNAAMEATVLGEVGKSHQASGSANASTAWDKIEAKAAEVAKRDSITKAKAIATVIKENPDMYKEYLEGGAN